MHSCRRDFGDDGYILLTPRKMRWTSSAHDGKKVQFKVDSIKFVV